jgi:glucosamine--fructose-6-phosphate aminotransferase (isomerizing)
MCGVFGYIGGRDALEVCLKGLEQLEYRGYDSTGIGGIAEGNLAIAKRAGKLSHFKKDLKLPPLRLAIAHTRWATHGKVTDANAHPHTDAEKKLALIHNGIIENFDSLSSELKKEGAMFASETDTEIVAHLVKRHYQGDLAEALQKSLLQLKGSFAFILIHKDHPDEIIAAALECPLSIAFNDEGTEAIISSDPNTFTGSNLNVLFLKNGEVARVQKSGIQVYGPKMSAVTKKTAKIEAQIANIDKAGFKHFMLKEIFEQPASIERALLGRIDGGVQLDGLSLSDRYLKSVDTIWLLGCGTSSLAGLIATLFLEDVVRLPSSLEISSEARYRNVLLGKKTLAIGISQSGETADTLAALRSSASRGCKTLGICNVKNSSLVREVDASILLNAGPEMSVCSTKAFTSQLAVLALFALYMGRVKGTISLSEMNRLLEELKKVPAQIQHVLDRKEELKKLGKKYAKYNNFFYMGRRYMYPTAMEAALKLKEISYVNANGYAAGELKHGPIALLDANFPVVAFCANKKTEDKIVSNLMEVQARGAPVLAFAPEHLKGIQDGVDDLFLLPEAIDELAPFASVVAGQLFAYYLADERGCDIDQPRNLAKSVTVE